MASHLVDAHGKNLCYGVQAVRRARTQMNTLRLSWPRAAHERAAYYVDHSSCFRILGGTPPAIAEGLIARLSGTGSLRVANLVTGSDSSAMGEELATHPHVRKLTFTGSTAVGKHLLRLAAGTIKRVSLELGGHSPFIVFEDADLDKAAAEAVLAGFRNSGQVCISVNRVLGTSGRRGRLHRPACGESARASGRKRFDRWDGLGSADQQGGVRESDRTCGGCAAEGARVVAGGQPPTLEPNLKGYFYEPTVLAGATLDMAVMREETFGPVLPVLAFATEEEALRIANDTPYGLAGYFFTENASRLFRVAERLECGIVGANTSRPVAVHFPFGGMKESGLGRENAVEGIEAFLEVKSVAIGL